jgi:hypothetical protein
MNRFFNGIADFFEGVLFPVFEVVARSVNGIIIIGGTIAILGWIVWETKNRNEPKSEH